MDKPNKQELMKLALEFPFYQWFYTEKSEINDLDKLTFGNAPILEKKFFFEFEEKYGKPYYTEIKECEAVYTESTSGTTGKPLEMVKNFKNLQLLYSAVGKALRNYLNRKPVMLVPKHPPGTWNKYWVQFPKRKEYKKVENLITVVNMPFDDILDPDEVSHHITTSGANVLFDTIGQWTYTLLKKGTPLKNLGIEVVLTINPEPHIWDEIAENFQWASMFGGTDGCGAITCPYMDRLGTYHPYEDYAEVYVLEGEKVKEFGEGLLVINKYNKQLFPFIKYTPHDLVKIEEKTCQCGESKYLYIRGRAAKIVRVPNQIDTTIRLDDVETVLSSEGSYLMVYAKIRSDKSIFGKHRALLSFVEKENVSCPKKSEKLSQKIADFQDRDFIAYALPVILVPEGTFTQTQIKDLKLRNFFKAIYSFPRDYLYLIDIAKEAGIEIIIPSEAQK
ncbi:MAG: hypothetical protein PVF58_12085 [Candidatus Methanofastidiosia archaeon]|jgi:hypothetical protein